jgi:hypothetical protein
MELSKVTVPGPMRMKRPALPNANGAGAAKQDVSNRRSMERSEPGRLPSQMRFARWNPPVQRVSESNRGVTGWMKLNTALCARILLRLVVPPPLNGLFGAVSEPGSRHGPVRFG